MSQYRNKKIAIYGGSFNPIHIGHLLTGFEIIEKLKYDYIMFVPDNIPVHKESSELVPSADRLKMVELATKNIDTFIFSDIEIKRGNFSYTYDTVIELHETLKYDRKFGIIFGDDLLEGVSSWKNFDELQNRCEFICLKRKKNIIRNQLKIQFLENRIIEISSSEIRSRIKNNLPFDFMVTDDVKNYIIEKQLYRT
jgi:nicotinate-nucleotide adenylyltransferase